MTTSDETDDLDHPELRQIVHQVRALSLAERLTVLKAIVPAIAADMTPLEFEGFVVELRLKGERFYDARMHPGQGRKFRHVPGERDVEGR
jgi:hypothetical protein